MILKYYKNKRINLKKLNILIDFEQIDCNKYKIFYILSLYDFLIELFSKNENKNKLIISSKKDINQYGLEMKSSDFYVEFEDSIDKILSTNQYLYELPKTNSSDFLYYFLKNLFKIEKISLPSELKDLLETRYTNKNDYCLSKDYFSYSIHHDEVYVNDKSLNKFREIFMTYNPNKEKYILSPDRLFYTFKYCRLTYN